MRYIVRIRFSAEMRPYSGYWKIIEESLLQFIEIPLMSIKTQR